MIMEKKHESCLECKKTTSSYFCKTHKAFICNDCKESHRKLNCKIDLLPPQTEPLFHIPKFKRSNSSLTVKNLITTRRDAIVQKLESLKSSLQSSKFPQRSLNPELSAKINQILKVSLELSIPKPNYFNYSTTISRLKKFNSELNCVQEYESPANKKLNLFSCIVRTGNKIWVIGGLGRDMTCTKDIHRLEMENREWDWKFKSLEGERSFSAAVRLGEEVLVIGGVDQKGNSLKTIEIFNINNPNRKNIIQNMNFARKNPSVCCFKNEIYIVSSEVSTVEKIIVSDNNLIFISISLPSIGKQICMITSYKDELIFISDFGAYLGNGSKIQDFKQKQRWSQSQITQYEFGCFYMNYSQGKMEKIKIE